jgi:hypothetical protein
VAVTNTFFYLKTTNQLSVSFDLLYYSFHQQQKKHATITPYMLAMTIPL